MTRIAYGIAFGARARDAPCARDDHANAAANLVSLVASCRLHGLDTELYPREVIHVLPQWPRDRVLELCPRDWARTRRRLVASELEREVGPITVPAA
jgi:transposase